MAAASDAPMSTSDVDLEPHSLCPAKVVQEAEVRRSIIPVLIASHVLAADRH